MIDILKNIALTVYTGENRFTMSRGSFRYRQKQSRKRVLKDRQTREQTDAFYVDFVCGKETFTFSFMQQGSLLRGELHVPEGTRYNRFRIRFNIAEDLHVYGCGEIHSAFDLSGQKVRVFVAEHQNAGRIAVKLLRKGLRLPNAEKAMKLSNYESYYAQPTFVTSGKWFFHAETKGFAEFDFSKPGSLSFTAQEPPVFWIGKADTFADLSELLTSLLGRQEPLPDWVNDGAILAIQEGTDAVERRVAAAQEAGAKVCGVWSQDWCGCRRTGFGYQVMWNWEWDKELYPDLDKKIPEWKARGIRFLGYINPFLALEKGLYKYAAEHGYCVKDKEGKDYLVTITTFPAAMIDLTNPEAWNWYKQIIRENMIGLGLGGWMADFGEYLPMDCVLHSGEDPEMLHNSWPALWARLNREAIREAGAEKDVFFFTRAGYTQTPKYSPMMWTGDQHVDWSEDDGIGSVIPATLSLAMSGFGITHSDVGGYTTVSKMTRSKELLLRWEEMNVFSPLYRFHEGNQPSRNVQFDTDGDLLRQLSLCSRLHAALKPYLKKLAAENTEKGTPVMRPLFYHYDEDPAYTERTEYLLGRDILVAPVLKKGADSREVWLPEDRWIHLFTGEEFRGGTHTVPAPVGTPPVFVRADSDTVSLLETVKDILKKESF